MSKIATLIAKKGLGIGREDREIGDFISNIHINCWKRKLVICNE